MIIVNSAMPRPKTSDGEEARCLREWRRGWPRRRSSPTPAVAKTTPSAASICGSTAAQPIASISRRPSCSGAEAGGRSQTKIDGQREEHAEAEEDVASPAWPRSSRSRRAACRSRPGCRSEAVTGMISAGRNRRLPSRSDQPCRARGVGGRRIAAAERAEAGEAGEAEHEQAVAEIAEPAAGEQAQRHQSPEGGIAEALAGWSGRTRSAARRRRTSAPASDDRPQLQRDHAPASAILRGSATRSSSSRRVPWMRKAAIAVGIAQTASSSGGEDDAVGGEGLLDQQDRADGDEDVLAEEQADIVGRGGIGLHLLATSPRRARRAAARRPPAPSARPAAAPSGDGRRSRCRPSAAVTWRKTR